MVKVHFRKVGNWQKHLLNEDCHTAGCGNKVEHLVMRQQDYSDREEAATKVCTNCLVDSYREMSEYVLQMAKGE